MEPLDISFICCNSLAARIPAKVKLCQSRSIFSIRSLESSAFLFFISKISVDTQ